MSVLVDSSIWVEYFRGDTAADDRLEWLIEEGAVAINDLILAELIPPLTLRKQTRLISLLKTIPLLPLEIDWTGLIADQVLCLRHGINKVGIPDLIIAQNARNHGVALFTHDKHFKLMSEHIGIDLF
ncbi:PIN domain-containing protein [Oscillatoria amoena NRMC-F 0135]|nr:PIN domain-containing protein [Oscillatoria laete-virens]MDL5050601.1 PIN domain-containing protein [Oscillatoria amoena NRMC-F 0135]MDL5055615.1 PIN domain-containing protein [Oscillatoria laete-virens NRMC-F 0139]